METKRLRAFDLPKMKIEYIIDSKEVAETIEKAKVYFSIAQDENGDVKCGMSACNDELFAILIAALHRNIFVHDLVRLALVVIEKFRDGDLQEAKEFFERAITYQKLKKPCL